MAKKTTVKPGLQAPSKLKILVTISSPFNKNAWAAFAHATAFNDAVVT